MPAISKSLGSIIGIIRTVRLPCSAAVACCLLYLMGVTQSVSAQTPSPMQEWQYSSGIILDRMFSTAPPTTQTIVGLGMELQPAYSGSRAYRVRGGPMVDIRWQDRAFLSTGEGVGYNIVHARGLQLGLSIAYDLGRKERADYANLRGMGDQSFSAVPKAFITWVVSEHFPLVVRADWRHLIRSGGGSIGDLGAYLPMPGSSAQFVCFLGPSVTFANRRFLRDSFGVSAQQSLTSGHPEYAIQDSGIESFGVGLVASWTLSPHYLLNANVAASRLVHAALNSPIVERASSHALAVSIDYRF